MSKKVQIAIAVLFVLGIIGAIVYQGRETTVYFQTPAEVLANPKAFTNKTIRIGAMVAPGSMVWDAAQVQLRFSLTEDGKQALPVVFSGVKPDMFKEGQGAVAEGRLGEDGVFRADQVLVKHSEEYKTKAKDHKDKAEMTRSLVK